MENFPRLVVCLFETDEPVLEPLRRLSRHWPQLILRVGYEVEQQRIKGLAKLQDGKLQYCQISY